ncbi:AraC family transcriptional regulator [Postechiella marina]|uniref:AraC family transcriptional regulator n=1 Tax=Postechiella marina TaxID=943941 RepID=A0ABP8C3U7_9FLAO
MELKYLPLEKSESESFYIKRKKVPYFGDNWHYHEEHELMFTIKGEGVRIVGDNMDHFKDHELVMIGGGLPHLFKNELKEKGSAADFIVIKFKDLFENQSFFSLPEFSKINEFIQNSKRGILFSKKTGKRLKKKLIKFSKSEGAEKIILFTTIFKILSEEKKYKYLSSEGFELKTSSKGEDRIQKVINYIGENYVKDISLEDLAKIAHMTTNSFCRYFKSRTGKTPFQFIREFRVNKACQMLINGEKSISQICYDTGFNSFSSFNRIFKKLKKISASEYKNKYIKLKS